MAPRFVIVRVDDRPLVVWRVVLIGLLRPVSLRGPGVLRFVLSPGVVVLVPWFKPRPLLFLLLPVLLPVLCRIWVPLPCTFAALFFCAHELLAVLLAFHV